MSEEPKKKSLDDQPENFRALVKVAPKLGDRRTVTKRFKKGTQVSFEGYEAPFIFEATCEMEVVEEWKKPGEYFTPEWKIVQYETETARHLPSRWQRIKAWFSKESAVKIPEARTVRR